MDEGYTIDHVVESGRLITLFSAPDYPQFQVLLVTSVLLTGSIDIAHTFLLQEDACWFVKPVHSLAQRDWMWHLVEKKGKLDMQIHLEYHWMCQ